MNHAVTMRLQAELLGKVDALALQRRWSRSATLIYLLETHPEVRGEAETWPAPVVGPEDAGQAENAILPSAKHRPLPPRPESDAEMIARRSKMKTSDILREMRESNGGTRDDD